MSNEVELARAIKTAAENMSKPAWLDLINLSAKEKFIKFQAFQRAGFNAKQALELVIREGDQ